MGAYALLVGIGEFSDPRLTKLHAPRSDVEEFAKVLADPERGGFDQVTTCVDEEFQIIREKIATLLEGRDAEDKVLLYYSGHGIVARGQRLYLATGQSSFDRPAALSLSALELRDWLKLSRAGRQIVILDCCHSGAFVEGAKGTAHAITGDTFGTDGQGQYVLTATDSLQFAYDAKGLLREDAAPAKLSRFTTWLVDAIGRGEAAPDSEEITMDALFDYLTMRARLENADMTPHCFVNSGSGEIVIARNPMAKPRVLAEGLVARLASADWRVRKDAVDELGEIAKQPTMRQAVRKVLRERVEGERNRDVAEAMLALLGRLGDRGVTDIPVRRSPGRAVRIPIDRRLKWGGSAALLFVAAAGGYALLPVSPGTEFKDCAQCPAMVVVPAGSFEMGSPESEEGRNENEGPQHRVNIRRPFAAGKYEVSFAEWDACVADAGCGGYRPDDEGWGRGNRPVMNVDWDDARGYVAWLRAKTGEEYRLLSEAEWEYAARAGTTTRYFWGDMADPLHARFGTNGTAPVGSYPSNRFGLYDMLGNVLEWTQDCFNETYSGAPGSGEAWMSGECDRHLVRGGYWADAPEALRAAARLWSSTGNRANYLGFRVARDR